MRQPGYLEAGIAFVASIGIVFVLYSSRKVRLRHLFAGAVAASLLWFLLRPAFHLFLTYNPGYGFAFGSLKSLFVVIIWIYISMALILFGAEIVSTLGRDETVYLKRLVEGKRNVPGQVKDRHVLSFPAGSVIFRDGDPGLEMYSVLAEQRLDQEGRQGNRIHSSRKKLWRSVLSPVVTPGGHGRCRGGCGAGGPEQREREQADERISGTCGGDAARDMAIRLREANKMVD